MRRGSRKKIERMINVTTIINSGIPGFIIGWTIYAIIDIKNITVMIMIFPIMVALISMCIMTTIIIKLFKEEETITVEDIDKIFGTTMISTIAWAGIYMIIFYSKQRI